jgi:hypothetical protein
MLSEMDNLLLSGEACFEMGKRFYRILAKPGERSSEFI